MKKNRTKGYAILGILFVLISVIAFAVPSAKTGAFWVTYFFTVTAFAAQIYIWKTALGKDAGSSRFLGFPVVHLGVVYLVVQLAAFVVFLLFPALPVWSAVVACVVITGVSACCMIAASAGRREIERVEAKAGKARQNAEEGSEEK